MAINSKDIYVSIGLSNGIKVEHHRLNYGATAMSNMQELSRRSIPHGVQ